MVGSKQDSQLHKRAHAVEDDAHAKVNSISAAVNSAMDDSPTF
jgi:hypothetical protein